MVLKFHIFGIRPNYAVNPMQPSINLDLVPVPGLQGIVYVNAMEKGWIGHRPLSLAGTIEIGQIHYEHPSQVENHWTGRRYYPPVLGWLLATD